MSTFGWKGPTAGWPCREAPTSGSLPGAASSRTSSSSPSPRGAAGAPGPSPFDGLELDIRLHGDENVILENSIGRVQGRFDLTLAGSTRPSSWGTSKASAGTSFSRTATFRVLRARLSFINPAAIEPYVDFLGETFLKDYRVTFS